MFNNVITILDPELNLQGTAFAYTTKTKLRDCLPELDSMAIENVVVALDERFCFEFPEEKLTVRYLKQSGRWSIV